MVHNNAGNWKSFLATSKNVGKFLLQEEGEGTSFDGVPVMVFKPQTVFFITEGKNVFFSGLIYFVLLLDSKSKAVRKRACKMVERPKTSTSTSVPRAGTHRVWKTANSAEERSGREGVLACACQRSN